MTDPHLDDEQLSLLLDGIVLNGRAHVEDAGCTGCGDRLAALRAARDAVASAVVAPLSVELLDQLVGAALDAPAVVPITSPPRRRRLTTPPPAWLVGAAAGIAALVGVAGLLRAVDVTSSDDDDGSLASLADEESSGGDADNAKDVAELGIPAGAGGTAVSGPIDPEVVITDLADQDDPAALALALREVALAGNTTAAFAAREAAPSAAATADASSGQSTSGGTGGSAAPASTTPVDRAQCRAQAEEIGAGRFAALQSTATLRWKGAPAEVLVFRLIEPSADGSITRQALVLSRPRCTLLADPRF